jgi:hypothetical protein
VWGFIHRNPTQNRPVKGQILYSHLKRKQPGRTGVHLLGEEVAYLATLPRN